MDVRQMRYFLEICKYGSISQAASSLYISQQGLSSAVRRLEVDLGCDLFYRKGNTLVLTEHGQYFLDHAVDIVNNIDKLQNHYRNIKQMGNTHLSLMIIYSVLSKSPLSLQQLLLREHKGIDLKIGECYTNECSQYLEDGACNFAICYEQDWCSQYKTDFLFRVQHCFVVHREHPLACCDTITPDQLNNARIIYPEKQTAAYKKLTDLLRTHNVHPNIVMFSSQALQICNLIMQDHSLIARLPLSDALSVGNPDLKIIQFRDIDFSSRVLLVHPKDSPFSDIERNFRQQVLNAVRNDQN